MPKKVEKRFESAVFFYVNRGKKVGHVARKKMIGPYIHGGSNLPVIPDAITALEALWARRLLDPHDSHWKYLFHHYINWMCYPYCLGVGIFDPAANEIPIPSDCPESFKRVLSSWRKVSSIPNRHDLCPDQIRAQNLFFNSHINKNNKHLGHDYKHVANSGVFLVSHLFNGNTIKDFTELQREIKHFVLDDYLDILGAIRLAL